MKKKILCFIFAFIFAFPVAFTLAGCGENPPPKDPPTTEEVLMAGLAESDFLSNFKLDIAAAFSAGEYAVLEGERVEDDSAAEAEIELTLQLDGQNLHAYIPGLGEAYLVNNQSFFRTLGGSTLRPLDGSAGLDTEMQVDALSDILGLFSQEEMVTSLINFARVLNEDAVTVAYAADVYTLTVNLDFKAFVEGVIENFFENKDKAPVHFINGLVSALQGTEFDLLEVIGEFEEDFTDDTTMGDLVEFLSEKTGLDIAKIITEASEMYYTIDSKTWHAEGVDEYDPVSENVYVQSGTYEENISGEFDYETASQVKISSLIEPEEGVTVKEMIFGTIEQVLANEEATLDMFIQMMLGEDNLETYGQILAVLEVVDINELEANFVITLNNEFSITGVNGELNVDLSMPLNEDEATGIFVNATFEAVCSEIGTTEIALPQEEIVEEYYVELEVSAEALENVTADVEISTAHLEYEVEDFEIQVLVWDAELEQYNQTPVTIASHEDGKLVLSKDFVNKVLDAEETVIVLDYLTEDECEVTYVIFLG